MFAFFCVSRAEGRRLTDQREGKSLQYSRFNLLCLDVTVNEVPFGRLFVRTYLGGERDCGAFTLRHHRWHPDLQDITLY
jgi:hypothetical protein